MACGEGVLQQHLKPHRYHRYLGIDFTPEAISCASKSKDEVTDFAVADATNFSTDQRFDAIIFNECLYYFANPIKIVGRYSKFLDEDGVFIISNFSSLTNLNTIRPIRTESPMSMMRCRSSTATAFLGLCSLRGPNAARRPVGIDRRPWDRNGIGSNGEIAGPDITRRCRA